MTVPSHVSHSHVRALDSGAVELPVVTIVVPARNEAANIGDLLGSIAASTYPLDRIEVIVVDGLSTDGTADIARSFHERLPRLRVVENRQRITPAAFNVGIRESSGAFVTILSGHSTIGPTYIADTVDAFDRLPADVVGGRIENVGHGFFGRVLAALTASPYVVGNARFRYSDVEQPVDTVLGTYRRSVFDRVGLFDERLLRNQDNEMNARIRQAKGVIYLVPKLSIRYRVRRSVGAALRQFFGNGRWTVYVTRLRGIGMSPRHFAPALFVAAVAGTASVGALRGVWWPFAAVALPYCGVIVLTACTVKAGVRERLVGLVLQPLLHIAYGLGSITGLFTRVPTQ